MKERRILNRLAEMAEPRNLFILPDWADSAALDRLIQNGLITFNHLQRSKGVISLMMGINLTPKAERSMRSSFDWPQLALRGSIAGMSATALSIAILYLA